MHSLFLCLPSFSVFVASALAETSVSAPRPNVIFILADDMGWGDAGCFGNEVIQTPNIDRMAAEGIRFTDAYSGAPVCAPARSVLMTGLHTGHTTVRANFSEVSVSESNPQGRVPLAEETITLAKLMKKAGYVTGVTGKWGLGEAGTSGVPNRQGFDEWFGLLNQRRAHSYFPDFAWENQEKVQLPKNADGARGDYIHDRFTDFALRFVETHRENPFFLYLAYTTPHDRYEIPSTEPYTDQPWSEDEKVYAAMITRMDRDIGRLMDALETAGIAENTLVMFCSDNGPARAWQPFNSAGPFRGIKRALYEGGLRSPSVAWWKGVIAAGTVSDLMWSFEDVMPTLAALAGVPPPENIDGVDISPALLGKPLDLSSRALYWEMHEGGPFRQASRQGRWKAMRTGLNGPILLFDLQTDISESNDVAAGNPEQVARFKSFLDGARRPSPYWPVAGE